IAPPLGLDLADHHAGMAFLHPRDGGDRRLLAGALPLVQQGLAERLGRVVVLERADRARRHGGRVRAGDDHDEHDGTSLAAVRGSARTRLRRCAGTRALVGGCRFSRYADVLTEDITDRWLTPARYAPARWRACSPGSGRASPAGRTADPSSGVPLPACAPPRPAIPRRCSGTCSGPR